jgi:hypothetical protein
MFNNRFCRVVAPHMVEIGVATWKDDLQIGTGTGLSGADMPFSVIKTVNKPF